MVTIKYEYMGHVYSRSCPVDKVDEVKRSLREEGFIIKSVGGNGNGIRFLV